MQVKLTAEDLAALGRLVTAARKWGNEPRSGTAGQKVLAKAILDLPRGIDRRITTAPAPGQEGGDRG